MKVFVSRAIPPAGMEYLKAAGGIEVEANPMDEGLSKTSLTNRAADAEGLLCLLTDTIDADFMAASPKLRVISNMAVGYNNIDIAAATKRGIVVTNTPGVLTDATADLTWALLLAVSRRIGEGERLVRSGQWRGWGPLQLLGSEVSGKTLGIIGLGRIGQAVARRALAFNMRILYYNRSAIDPNIEKELRARRVGLDEIFEQSDFVSVHAPYTKETHHMVNAERLSFMKSSAYLINTSRGTLVDEAALVEALRENRIGGAGLDVFEREPELAPGLADLENVVIVPHLGSATIETRNAMSRLAAVNLVAALRGERPPNPVNPEVLKKS
jgi:glyoxylate reductase